MRAALAPLLLTLFAACSEYSYKPTSGDESDGPIIEVDPTEIDFGAPAPGTESSEVFTIRNVGGASLRLTAITLEGSDTFTLWTDDTTLGLPPGEETEVIVTYLSSGDVEEGVAIVASDDPLTPEVDVLLMAGDLVPGLEIEPNPLDFGLVSVGTLTTDSVTLSNGGSDTLTVDDITVDGAAFDASWGVTLPYVMYPGESFDVSVDFLPTTSGDFEGSLVVTSDDPESPGIGVLLGEGAEGPIASCFVTPDEVSAHAETATWMGDESYDPSGGTIVDFDWTLISQPSGSSAVMPTGTGPNRSGFLTDLAGTYVGQLIVTNDRGESSDPCTAELEAIPSEDLWIEMYWTRSGDDMDLHLLAPGGSIGTTSDCHWTNCTPSDPPLNWGGSGSADNPGLDIDDIDDIGPENINIEEPQDGTFTVIVHDYPSSVYSGANQVTVNIYVGGALTWTDTRSISGENSYEYFATIEWPSGDVTSM